VLPLAQLCVILRYSYFLAIRNLKVDSIVAVAFENLSYSNRIYKMENYFPMRSQKHTG
jgi:hypothetical protein